MKSSFANKNRTKRPVSSFLRLQKARRHLKLCRHLACEPLEDRRLLSLSVGDFVWNDLNPNGIQEVAEPGVAGAVVEVFSSPDGVVGNADDIFRGNVITDANGHYQLGSLEPDVNYYLVTRTPVGYTFTTAHSGSDDARDSDADASGVTPMFTLSPGQDNFTLDAGLVGSSPDFGFALSTRDLSPNGHCC